MSRNGKTEYDDNFKHLAEQKIEKSGYSFLNGYYYYLLTNMAYTSAWNYTYKVIRFLDEELIEDPSEIKLDHYVKHLAGLKDSSSSNRITSYAAMKKFSKYLYAKGICKDDYMRFVERPKAVETQEQIDKRMKGVLTKNECRNAIDKAKNDQAEPWMKARDSAILSVFISTGIRRAAMYKLDVNDFDFNNNTISVIEKGSIYRKVYCPDSVMKAVKEWFNYRDQMVDKSETAAFISERKRRISAVALSNVVTKYTGKTPHKLRATCVTELYNKTGDIYFVQKTIGHASPQTTEVYIRGKEKENAKKMARIMNDFLE